MICLTNSDPNSVLQRGGQGVLVLENRLRALGQDDYGTSIVSFEEQCRGWTDYIHRAATPASKNQRLCPPEQLPSLLLAHRRLGVDPGGRCDLRGVDKSENFE